MCPHRVLPDQDAVPALAAIALHVCRSAFTLHVRGYPAIFPSAGRMIDRRNSDGLSLPHAANCKYGTLLLSNHALPIKAVEGHYLTYYVPKYKLGQVAVDVMHNLVTSNTLPPAKTSLIGQFVERASTAQYDTAQE